MGVKGIGIGVLVGVTTALHILHPSNHGLQPTSHKKTRSVGYEQYRRESVKSPSSLLASALTRPPDPDEAHKKKTRSVGYEQNRREKPLLPSSLTRPVDADQAHNKKTRSVGYEQNRREKPLFSHSACRPRSSAERERAPHPHSKENSEEAVVLSDLLLPRPFVFT
eukprot:scaffold16446_cov24-Tisochrysis_lutea.AAC.1